MIGQGMHGFVGNRDLEFDDPDQIAKELANPTDMRIFVIAMALYRNYSIDEIHSITKIDKWFLSRLRNIIDIRNSITRFVNPEDLPDELILEAKKSGFSDFQIARLLASKVSITEKMESVRALRLKKNIVPYVKQIDTLAAEYPAATNYLYLTYHGTEHDVTFGSTDKPVIVLGSGAYRIGSSVEFDWCSVNAVQTVRKNGIPSIMINYNPETVSTDYDACDRLYFDELSYERVMDIIGLENPRGVILSVGGQIPNNLAMRLSSQNVPILGTSAESVDMAEDRHKFSSLLDTLGIAQPRWKELSSIEDIHLFAESAGYPLLIRPSYVLSGAAMNVVSNQEELDYFLREAANVSKQYPVVVSEFIEYAKEVEIDAVAKNGEMIVYAISEHVEYAGVHSGDATIVFPAQKLYIETIRKIKQISRKIATALKISGPFNIQFLAKDNQILVIECNLRASRSFPFVSKVLKTNFIETATEVMLGKEVTKPEKSIFDLDYVGVKAPQFSFSRLAKADPVLGVEMASTGEVGCLGDDYYEALLKAMLSVGYRIPEKNIMLSTGPVRSKTDLLDSVRLLHKNGFNLFATPGTAKFLEENNIEVTALHWPDEKAEPNVLTYIRQKKLDMVINIPKNLSSSELNNDYQIRRSAIDFNIPLITNTRLAIAFIQAFSRYSVADLPIRAWEEY